MSNRDFELEFSRLQDIADVAFEQARERAEVEEDELIVTEYGHIEISPDPTYETPVQQIMRQMVDESCAHDRLYLTWACVECGAVRQPDGTFCL